MVQGFNRGYTARWLKADIWNNTNILIYIDFNININIAHPCMCLPTVPYSMKNCAEIGIQTSVNHIFIKIKTVEREEVVEEGGLGEGGS